MAISIIGTPQTANANNGGNATITWSTTPSENDYTVVVIGSPAPSAAKGTMVTSGYTELTSHTGAAAANPSLAIFYKKQGASPDTTAVGTSGNGSETDSSLVGFVLRGVDSTTFSDATPTTAGETTSTNPDPASITVGTTGACVIVAACMTVVKDTAITAPSGYTGYSVVGDDTYDHTLAAAYKLDCSGTEAPASWTLWDSGLWYAITIAVKPAAGNPQINVFDSVNVSENITSQVPNQYINVYDSVNVSEQVPPAVYIISYVGLLTKVGSVALPTTTGSQSYIGVGFQPKAILFWGNTLTADGFGANAVLGMGLASSSTARGAVSYMGEDAQNPTDAARIYNASACYVLVSEAETATVVADLVSFDANGFTINLTTASGSAHIMNYVAFGGDQLTNSFVKFFDGATGTGDQVVDGVGFKPDAVIILDSGITGPATTGNSGLGSFGWATGASSEGVVSVRIGATVAAQVNEKKQLTNAVIHTTNGGATLQLADLKSFDDDGFTLTWTTAGGARQNIALCLKGGSYKAGYFDQPTSAGDSVVNDVGFRPSGVMLMSWNSAASTSLIEDHKLSFGAASSPTSRASTWTGDQDNATPQQSNSRLDQDEIITMYSHADTPTLDAEADFTSFDDTGFTISWSSADATARQVLYLAAGNTTTTLGPSVFDSVNVSEGVTVLQANLVLSVYDPVGVSEDVVAGRNLHEINVYDLVNVSELDPPTTELVEMTKLVDVFDTVNISEGITILENNLVLSVYDSVTATENITSQASPQTLSVYDSIQTSEEVTVFIPALTTSVFDTVNISEGVTAKVPTEFVDVFDSATAQDVPTVNEYNLIINVFDPATVTENIVSQSYPLTINVYDSVTATENVQPGGNAVFLDATGKYGVLTNFDAIDSLTDFTMETWVKNQASSVAYSTVLRLDPYDGSASSFASISTENAIGSTGINFNVKYDGGTNAGGYTTTAYLTVDTWVHVALVHNATAKTAKIYVNGTEISYTSNDTGTGSLRAHTTTDFWLGNDTKNIGGVGGFARVWNTVRTATELSDNKSLILDPSQESGLIINMNFTESQGTSIENTAPTGGDVSLTGSPSWGIGPGGITTKSYAEKTVNVYDSVGVSEDVVAARNRHEINIYDSVTVTEDITTGTTPKGIDIYDSINAFEDIAIVRSDVSSYTIDVYNSVNLSEGVSIEESGGAPAVLEINVYDSLAVSESTTPDLSIPNNVIYFNADGYGKILNFSAIDAINGTLTVEFYLKAHSDAGNWNDIFSIGDDGLTDIISIKNDSGIGNTGLNTNYSTSGNHADAYKTSGVTSLTALRHIAVVWESGVATKYYVNGSSVTPTWSQTPTGTYSSVVGDIITIGNCPEYDDPLDGELGVFFRIWNTARSSTQISENYQYQLTAANETGLIVNLKFTEEGGTSVVNEASPGNDYNLVVAAPWVEGLYLADKDYGVRNVEVNDSVGVSEVVSFNTNLSIGVSDNVEASDEAGSLHDDISISENVGEEYPFGEVDQTEDLYVSEVLEIQVPLFEISVSDDVTVSDSVEVYKPSSEASYDINIYDDLTVAETTNCSSDFLEISVFDSVATAGVIPTGIIAGGWATPLEPSLSWTDTTESGSLWTDTSDPSTGWN